MWPWSKLAASLFGCWFKKLKNRAPICGSNKLLLFCLNWSSILLTIVNLICKIYLLDCYNSFHTLSCCGRIQTFDDLNVILFFELRVASASYAVSPCFVVTLISQKVDKVLKLLSLMVRIFVFDLFACCFVVKYLPENVNKLVDASVIVVVVNCCCKVLIDGCVFIFFFVWCNKREGSIKTS